MSLSSFKHTFLRVFLLMLAGPALASGQDFTTRSITVANGLSQSSVYSMEQDQNGFMWIGTQDGLNKYDGITCKVYRNEPFDSLSLPSAFISSLLCDSRNRLWVGTSEEGLALFLPGKDQFRSFLPRRKGDKGLDSRNIFCIAEENGRVWIGTGDGLFRAKENAGGEFSFELVKLLPDSAEQPIIYNILLKGDTAWMSSSSGVLFVHHLDKPVARKIIVPMPPNYRSQAMALDNQGRAWIVAVSTVFRCDPRKGEVRKMFSLADDEKIASLHHSSSGILWIGSSRGLYSVAKADSEQPPQPVRVLEGTKEISNGIMAVREDRLSPGMLWIGTDVNGVVQAVPVRKPFVSDNLASITSSPFVFSIFDDGSFLWLGTTNGLLRLHGKDKPVVFRPDGKDGSLSSPFITTMFSDSAGFWVGTPMGLHHVENPASARPRFNSVQVNPDFKSVRVRWMGHDLSGAMLVALPKKIFRRDKDGHFSSFIDITKTPQGKPDAVFISSAWVDAGGRIWVGTTDGLAIYDRPDAIPLWVSYSMKDTTGLRNNMIQNIHGDSRGRTWVSTFNGFSRVDIQDGKVRCKNYSTKDGLVNNTVYGFLEDASTGTLWLSTNGGLSKFDPISEKFTSFTMSDGLQSNEFNGNSFFRSASGRMYFGGVNGYTTFLPSAISTDTVPPHVLITGYTQGGQYTSLAGTTEEKRITVPYNRNSVSLDFIGLQFTDPSRNRYAYRLDGHDTDWIACGNNTSVNFSGLSPGTYKFRVVAANADGVFNWRGDTLTIIVEPPFWKTAWFYLLAAALVVTIVLLLHRYRLRMKEQQMREIEKIRRDTAADFHDELGHRLTTISWFSEVLKKRIPPGEKEMQSYVSKIIDTSGNLYHTMKDLVWAMDPQKDSVLDLYSQLKVFGEGIFDQTGIRFDVQPVAPTIKNAAIPLVYKRHVLLILKEAMHNSFRHSQCTETQLRLTRENGSYSLFFRDNGRGFDPANSAAGNGLKNILKRAELIQAQAEVSSGAAGTSLTLTFHVPE